MCVNLFILRMFKISVYKEEIFKSENQRLFQKVIFQYKCTVKLTVSRLLDARTPWLSRREECIN